MLFLAVGIGATGLGLLAYATDAFEDLELDTVDARFSIRGEQRAAGGPRGREDRRRHVRGAQRALALPPVPSRRRDRQHRPGSPEGRSPTTCSSPSRARGGSSEEDFAFAEAILNAKGKVVLATTEVNERAESKFLGGPPGRPARTWTGRWATAGCRPTPAASSGDSTTASTGSRRSRSSRPRSPRGARSTPTASGRTARGSTTTGRPTRSSPSPSRAWPRARSSAGFFRDKMVVVGPYAPTLQDVHPTSTTAGDEQMSGVEIQASALSTVLRGFPLQGRLERCRGRTDRPARAGGPAGEPAAVRALVAWARPGPRSRVHDRARSSPSTTAPSSRSSIRWARSCWPRSEPSPSTS